MEHTREELRDALSKMERRGRGCRYPKSLLEGLLSYTVARRRQGATLLKIGDELGISWKTLARWLSIRKPSPKFQPVQVVASAKRDVVVHGPCGVRIEGLDIEGIAQLVRRLGR